MIRRAIASGIGHGVNLVPGRKNAADGNCAFESAIFNNNDRDVFEDSFRMSVAYYRREWISKVEERFFYGDFNPYQGDPEKWKRGIEEVKRDKVWAKDYFGD